MRHWDVALPLCEWVRRYEREHGHEMPVSAMAQMLSIMLYNRRFFPYYTFNIVGGLDEHGIVSPFPVPFASALVSWDFSPIRQGSCVFLRCGGLV